MTLHALDVPYALYRPLNPKILSHHPVAHSAQMSSRAHLGALESTRSRWVRPLSLEQGPMTEPEAEAELKAERSRLVVRYTVR